MFESRPSFSPVARSAPSTGSASSYSSKWCACAQAPSISTAAAYVSPVPPMPSMIRSVKSTQISSSWSSSGCRFNVANAARRASS